MRTTCISCQTIVRNALAAFLIVVVRGWLATELFEVFYLKHDESEIVLRLDDLFFSYGGSGSFMKYVLFVHSGHYHQIRILKLADVYELGSQEGIHHLDSTQSYPQLRLIEFDRLDMFA